MVYDISYKTWIGVKPLRIRFEKVDGFIRVSYGTRYFPLFSPEKYDAIYKRIRYIFLQLWKNQNWKKKTTKKMTLYNDIIPIKSVINKNQNDYYLDISLDKCSYQLAEK